MLKRTMPFLTALLAVILAASGCYPFHSKAVVPDLKAAPPTGPTITMPAAEATAEMVTATAPVTPTTAAVTDTPAASPTVPASTATAAAGVIITAENAKDLVEVTATLPGPMGHIAWLASDVKAIPSSLAPRPQMVLISAPDIYPITVGDTLTIGKPAPLPLPDKDAQVLALAPGGSSMVVQTPTEINAYGLDGKLIRALPGLSSGMVYGPLYDSSGQYLVVTTPDKIQAYVFNMRDTSLSRLEGFETAAPVYTARISPGCRWLAWVSRATMQFQDVNAPNSKPGAKLSFMDFIGAWAFSPVDGSRMALYVQNQLSVYSVPDAKELVTVTTGQPVNWLDWSPNGKLLAGGYGNSLQIWDAATLEPVASLKGPNDFTGQVMFSPDGQYIFSVHDNNVIGVWKLKK